MKNKMLMQHYSLSDAVADSFPKGFIHFEELDLQFESFSRTSKFWQEQ